MPELDLIPGTISWVIWFPLLALKAFAFVDAIRRPQEAFPAADKQTKQFWLIILGLSLFLHLIWEVPNPLSLFNLVGVVASAVYVVGVLPALRGSQGRRNDGPYGPW